MTGKPERLLVLWASGDKDTANHMVMLYTNNTLEKGWWQEVTLLIWGAATRLTAEDTGLQEKIRIARESGVRVIACLVCAEAIGAVESLEACGVEVFKTGVFLTDWLKSGDPLLTI